MRWALRAPGPEALDPLLAKILKWDNKFGSACFVGVTEYSGLLALIKSGNILWGMQASPRGFIPDFAGCCASGGGVPPPGQKPRLCGSKLGGLRALA